MTSLNPQVLRSLFTELALNLAIDPDEHPSDIIQETIRRLEDLKREHKDLLARYDLARARIANRTELIHEIQDLDDENEALRERYVFLKAKHTDLKMGNKALWDDHRALRVSKKEQETLIAYQEELSNVYEMYTACSRSGFDGVSFSAQQFIRELAEILGFRESDFNQEVVLDSILRLTIEATSNAEAAATATVTRENVSREAEEAKQKARKLEKKLKAMERDSNRVLDYMGQWYGSR